MQGFLRIFTKNLAFYKQYIMYSLLILRFFCVFQQTRHRSQIEGSGDGWL